MFSDCHFIALSNGSFGFKVFPNLFETEHSAPKLHKKRAQLLLKPPSHQKIDLNSNQNMDSYFT